MHAAQAWRSSRRSVGGWAYRGWSEAAQREEDGDHDHSGEPAEHRTPRDRRAERRRRRALTSATRSSRTSPAWSRGRGGKGSPSSGCSTADKGSCGAATSWRIVPELAPGEAEPLVEKSYGDSFEDTILETVLSDLGVGRLVVVGAQTDACIRSTLHGAFARGYDATLVGDAHTTEDLTAWGAPPPDQVIAHTNLYWTYQTAPGRTAGTVETKDVDFSGTS